MRKELAIQFFLGDKDVILELKSEIEFEEDNP